MSHDIMSSSEGRNTMTAVGTLTGIKPTAFLSLSHLDSYPRSCIHSRLQGPHHTGDGGQQE